MQAFSLLRVFGFAAACTLAACGTQNSTGGETPAPSPSGLTNSTAAPQQALTTTPGSKFIAQSGAVKDVTFAVWANGSPIATVSWPNKAIDITKQMRGHANTLVIKWTKTKKDGTGTLSIISQGKAKVLTAMVTAKSPMNGTASKTFIAPQAPSGRP